MSFAVAKEAGASIEELQEAAAIAMTVQATRIRNTFHSMNAVSEHSSGEQNSHLVSAPTAKSGLT
jgi:hypothetical protein